MENSQVVLAFDQKRAASYDKGNAFLAPMRAALDALMCALFAELPVEARILCVGAGTGLELISLSQAFPQWQFTVVEPAAPMLEVCRQRVEEHDFTSRCIFHEGYLDSLPASAPFDAATCLLVSHFFTKPEERRQFFQQIAVRLRPQAYLVSSDLSADTSTAGYQELLTLWLQMIKSPEMSDEDSAKFRESLSLAYSRDVGVLPPHEVEAIIASSGFDPPVLFFQNLLIHAWFSKRTP